MDKLKHINPLKNGLLPLRLLLSAIGTRTYQLAKLLVSILSDTTQNGFSIQDFFAFLNEILTSDSDLYKATLYVDALFTNIPLNENTNICIRKLFQNHETLVKIISKNDSCDLLILAIKELFSYI